MIFGFTYSALYDYLYADKPYQHEVDDINKCINRYLDIKNRKINILDAGCGTGNHSKLLVNNDNYHIVGMDISESMLDHARKKVNIDFVRGDITQFELSKEFDVVLTMAAVLGYQKSNEKVMNAFKCARKHLLPGGLYIFDVWYGPAVLYNGVKDVVKEVDVNKTKYVRISRCNLIFNENICHVNYKIRNNFGLLFVEDHYVRYFFPVELEHLLKLNNFEVLDIGQCPNIDLEPNLQSWHMMVVAKAV